MEKQNNSYLRKIRYVVQWGIFALIIWAGIKFYIFVEAIKKGTIPTIERPPLVDGFLPIGGLMGLKLWLTTRIFDPVHPASVVILASAIIVSLIVKKGFCGWICPVGTLSEAVYKIGRKVFGKNLIMPKPLDYFLRAIKYLLLGFFIFIVGRMSPDSIRSFLAEPYWKVADIKMLYFFTKMTTLTFFVLLGLFVLSLFFKNFWCRYLCPYGALLGLLSLISPSKILRNEHACIHCHRCTLNCPQQLPVEDKIKIKSPECTGCLTCVSVCPSKGALDISNLKNPILHIALVLVLFFGIIGIGRLTGHWKSNVSYEEYKALIPISESLKHP